MIFLDFQKKRKQEEKQKREKSIMEDLSSQLPTLDKYIGRIKRQQTEDKDCSKWDVEVSL